MAPPKPNSGNPFPIEDSIVSETEQFTYDFGKIMKDDVKAFVRDVVGDKGRPYGNVRLSPEEAYMRYVTIREKNDPALWAQQIQTSDDPKGLINDWIKHEERWRKEQQPPEPPFDVEEMFKP